MAVENYTPSRRWTPAAIRKATPFPKPRDEIAKIVLAHQRFSTVLPAEARLLEHFANNSDVINAGAMGLHGDQPALWLLTPIPSHLLELLIQFGASTEDFEEGHDLEADEDAEPDVDEEASLGACEQISQKSWGVPQQLGHVIDGEAEDELFENGDEHEPECGGRPACGAPDWAPHLFLPSESTEPGLLAVGIG